MPKYKGSDKRVMQTSERIRKKLPALVVVMTTFAALIYLAGARTFGTGFLYSFGLRTIVKLYVTFVLNCGWHAHTPSAWIPETEDIVGLIIMLL